MIGTQSSWQTLGIDPTEDKRAIKRAYAARLKATDVDNDPKAFIALREAFNSATWESEYLDYRDDDYDDEVEVADTASEDQQDTSAFSLDPISDEEIAPLIIPLPSHHSPAISDDLEDEEPEDPTYWRWEPERQPATEADQEAIIALLWGERPIDEIEVELVERTHAILSAPEMENIDHASGIEDWLASIIAQSMPRSDAMARVAVPHFGWADEAGNWRQRYGVSQAAARFGDIEAVDRLNNTGHRWHDAWMILKQPPPDAMGWKNVAKHRSEIIALLQSIRHHSPGVESELNADHIQLWEAAMVSETNAAAGELTNALTPGRSWGLKWYWWVFIALYGFLQLARGLGGS